MGAGGGDRRLMSEINVTPFVDVMLVLLIIFMVTAPMMQEGMSVNVPKVQAGPLDQREEEPIILVIARQGQMSIKRQDVTLQSLPAELQKIFASRADKTVYLRADQDVPYGLVVEAMAIAKQAGADRLSIITQPEEKRKP
jgi:biopolymer transport protein TolR